MIGRTEENWRLFSQKNTTTRLDSKQTQNRKPTFCLQSETQFNNTCISHYTRVSFKPLILPL